MKVLVVCSYREYSKNGIAAFVYEQAEAIRKMGVTVEYYLVKGNGLLGYLSNVRLLRNVIRKLKPDVVHAHYGLCGLLANLATRSIPVVTTYHGSDINIQKSFRFSRLAIRLSYQNIFVSSRMFCRAGKPKNGIVIPCGVDTDRFVPMDKIECRKKLNLQPDKKYVLFSQGFDEPVKNYPLAHDALCIVSGVQKQLGPLSSDEGRRSISYGENLVALELKGYRREEVVWLMNAVDVALLTSHTEGSPQFVKEALACGCPVVSVDVGDVKEVMDNVQGCYVVDNESVIIADKLSSVFKNNIRNSGRDRIKDKYSQQVISKKIYAVYQNK